MYKCASLMCHVWYFGPNSQSDDESTCPGCSNSGIEATEPEAKLIKAIHRGCC